MVNSTRSSQRAKDEETSNGRVTRSSEKGKINAHPNVSDTAGIRKSPRETSSKKITASPSNTRKSEPVKKKTPPTPAARRKSERVEKKKMPSPLTSPGRTRSHSSSCPSDSKSSGSFGSIQKQKKEKSVKQLTFEAKEVNENEERELGTSKVKTKKMDARMYRSIFKQRKKDCLGKSNRIGESNQEGDNNSGAENGTLPSEDAKAKETRVDSRLNGTVTGLVENNVTPGSFIPPDASNYETGVVPERIQPDCCGEETLPMSVSRNSILDEDLVRNSIGHDGSEKLVPSKRKGITVDMDSAVSATLSKDDNDNLISDGSPSRLGGNVLGTDRSCSKRIRLDHNPTVNESCNPCATEDRDDIEATMLQKDYPANIAKNICLICKDEGQLLIDCGLQEQLRAQLVVPGLLLAYSAEVVESQQELKPSSKGKHGIPEEFCFLEAGLTDKLPGLCAS